MSIYQFTVKDIDGNPVSLEKYKGKVLLIVNTASKCRFTVQYEDLQKLYDRYRNKGFEILAFPCNQFKEQEPGSSQEIKQFCSLNYGVTFPIFEKINVNGENAYPLYQYLKEKAPYEGLDLSVSTNRLFDAMVKEVYPQYSVGNAIRWNFTKFLVNKNGKVVKRFEPPVSPIDIEPYIEELLV